MLQERPDGSPHSQGRTPRPPKRGSITSPGQEALSKAAHWLALLVCCHYKASLAPEGLVLVNDLIQLLYYHGSNVAHRLEPEEQDGDIHLLSPLVQVCLHLQFPPLQVCVCFLAPLFKLSTRVTLASVSRALLEMSL